MHKRFHVALVLSLNKRFDRKVIEGITRFVKETGTWSVFLEDDPEAKIPDFNRGTFNGVLADLDDSRIPKRIAGLTIPIIGIGGITPSYAGKLTIPTVGTDDYKIATMAADYLINLNIRSFGYCGLQTRTIDPWNKRRETAFRSRLREKGHSCAIFKAKFSASRSWEELQNALGSWLKALPKPVGILAANDVRARHVLEACHQFDMLVPDEVSVLGVDNDELICNLAIPPLSSIIQGTEEIGYQAACLLHKLMCKRKIVNNTLIPPVTIIERESTDLIATSNTIVSKALMIIRQQACSGIGVKQVVEQLPVSRTTLENNFKAAIGRSVHSEILRLQINQAKMLLTTTEISLEQIALRSGFCHAQYLVSLFQKNYNMTPGEYRRLTR